jgi:hypothetical protein
MMHVIWIHSWRVLCYCPYVHRPPSEREVVARPIQFCLELMKNLRRTAMKIREQEMRRQLATAAKCKFARA